MKQYYIEDILADFKEHNVENSVVIPASLTEKS